MNLILEHITKQYASGKVALQDICLELQSPGMIGLLGPNGAGKSTLMNAMVGEKVAIVSNRPQTTRNRIMGVATDKGWQIVFLDTPGLHKPRTRLGEYMVKAAHDADRIVAAVRAG